MRPETERWLDYASEDLETVRVTLAGRRWAAASFYAQQAAEKALKAMFMERVGAEVPKIHDLVRLAREVQLAEDWLRSLMC